MLDGFFNRLIAEMKRPAWEREPVELHEHSLAARYAASVVAIMQSVSDLYPREEARVRLLACHAALRRYRWEYEKLPPSLEVLNLGDLTTDPFTGQPLRYEVSGKTYQLTSAGPTATENSKAVNGRLPISIVLEK